MVLGVGRRRWAKTCWGWRFEAAKIGDRGSSKQAVVGMTGQGILPCKTLIMFIHTTPYRL